MSRSSRACLVVCRSGKKLKFKVKAFDPDGDNLTLSWAQYKVFGAYQAMYPSTRQILSGRS